MGIKDTDLWRVNRRHFLALSVGLVTAMSLGGQVQGCSGDKVPRRKMWRQEEHGERVLVTYASKYGSTGGVADAIRERNCAARK